MNRNERDVTSRFVRLSVAIIGYFSNHGTLLDA
jgi:hypothetical protein